MFSPNINPELLANSIEGKAEGKNLIEPSLPDDTSKPKDVMWPIAIAVPIGFFLIAGMIKKVARGKVWKLEDWCLGPDATMGSLTTASLYLLELYNRKVSDGVESLYLGTFFFVVLIMLLWIIAEHQEYHTDIQGSGEKRTERFSL